MKPGHLWSCSVSACVNLVRICRAVICPTVCMCSECWAIGTVDVLADCRILQGATWLQLQQTSRWSCGMLPAPNRKC